MAKRTTPEGQVLRACLDYLALAKIRAWRNNTGALPDATGRPVRFGLAGSSDILGVLPGGRNCSPGRFLAVECKAPGGRTTDLQDQFLASVTQAGGLALVVRSMDDLRRGLREAGYEVP